LPRKLGKILGFYLEYLEYCVERKKFGMILYEGQDSVEVTTSRTPSYIANDWLKLNADS
jgi:hypothetical protein